jgi:DNA-binding MarR family transcriptional regulator
MGMSAAPQDGPPPLSRLPGPLVERSDYLVRRLGEALRVDTERALRAVRLTEHQYTILQIVAAGRECSRHGVEELSDLDPTSVSIALGALVRRGALVVERPESDRRKRIYLITAEGRRLLADAEEKTREVRARTLGALGGPERHAFLDYLRRLVEQS